MEKRLSKEQKADIILAFKEARKSFNRAMDELHQEGEDTSPFSWNDVKEHFGDFMYERYQDEFLSIENEDYEELLNEVEKLKRVREERATTL